MPASDDPFEDVFNLEDGFYRQGYQQGLEDGEQAGRIEGRQFGMSKGFDKFLESGYLAGRATVWANRLPGQRLKREEQEKAEGKAIDASGVSQLPALPNNARLDKNVKMLYALVEPETLSTQNSDEAVQDFDDRVKRAQGKMKVVERMVGQRS